MRRITMTIDIVHSGFGNSPTDFFVDVLRQSMLHGLVYDVVDVVDSQSEEERLADIADAIANYNKDNDK